MKSERSTIVRRTISHMIREGQHRNAHALALLPGANQQGLPTQVWQQGTPPTSKLNPFGKSRPMLETGPSKTIATLPLHAALQRPSRRLLRSGDMRSYLRGNPIAVHFNSWFQWFYMYRKTDSQVITSVLVLYRASSASERSRLQTRSMHGV
jgi:hypothetical protein